MKQFIVFVRKEFRHIFRDRKSLLIIIMMPIVQIILFGFALTNEIKNSNIAVLDNAKDESSRSIIQRLDASRYFNVTRYLQTLTNDLLFKIVFGSKGNEKLLALMLNALLCLKGSQQIEELEILNPINLPEWKNGKQSVIDVKARDISGEVYCVEIQVKAHAEILKRVLFYSAASYTRQIVRGTKYADLNRTICLWIMCETTLSEPEIYNKYLIKHDKNNNILTDLMEYHFVELSKFDKSKPAELQNRFEKWLHILKFGDYYRSDSELPGELKKEKGICEVIKQMSTANTDEHMRYELLAREMFLSDLATDLDAAEKKGIEKGIEKVALKMLAKGKSFEEIAEATDLTIDQIKAIASNNKFCEPAAPYKAPRKRKTAT